ncbi:MAG: hypothetical protein ACI3ZT_00105 [Candidatus Cryptobacteroides sp.]
MRNVRIILILAFVTVLQTVADARTYHYYSDSLRLDFNVCRRQDADDFTGVLYDISGGDHSQREILLNWDSSLGRARLLVVNGRNINTFDIDSLSWPRSPEKVKVSTVIYFRTDKAVIGIEDRKVIIDRLGLSLNVGYDISVLPELSRRPDPNIPALVEYSDMVRSESSDNQRHRVWIWLAGICLVNIILSIAVVFRQRSKRRDWKEGITEQQRTSSSFTLRPLPSRSAILLFGGFRVYDSEGEDITRLFSPMLKELLVLILIYSADKGITSTGLKDELWPDKDLKSARNNRAVYMRKLRDILVRVGSFSLDTDSGYWLFKTGDIFVDYLEFRKLKNTAMDDSSASEMMTVVQRGSLLPEMDSPWLDPFKSDAADMVIDVLGKAASGQDCEKKTEFALLLAETMEHFDDLNEKALHLKCRAYVLSGRHSSAKTAYDLFVQRYKEIYGSSFQYDFSQLINTPSDVM